jgi:hypothetical protein
MLNFQISVGCKSRMLGKAIGSRPSSQYPTGVRHQNYGSVFHAQNSIQVSWFRFFGSDFSDLILMFNIDECAAENLVLLELLQGPDQQMFD